MDFSTRVNKIYNQLLEETLTEMIFQAEIEMHFENSIQSQLKRYIKEETTFVNCHDIFNNANSKELNECVCPNCGRTVGAVRFAPHLEKCVGMGRSSSRIASRRIQASSNSGKEVKYAEDEDSNGSSQLQNNVEWVPTKSSRRVDKRRKRDRSSNHCRNKKKPEETNGNNNEGGDDLNYATMNAEVKHHFLAHMCGVVSEHTRRLCTRSVRCPKHSDEQKNSVRLAVLGYDSSQTDFIKMNEKIG